LLVWQHAAHEVVVKGAKVAVPRVALTPAEAAVAIGCSAEFFREHVDHELRWIRRGRKRFVPVVELVRWAEENAERVLP
jgi:hypothetical protein